jgi:uncharacterized protein with ATP-grasp and redox domains
MKSYENNRKGLESMNAKATYQADNNPELDAWLTAFFIENHLDYFTHPDQAATPEQTRFMVYIEEGERYYPCSDRMFTAIMSRKQSVFIQENYKEVLERILELIDRQIENKREKQYLEALIKIKYKHETRDEIMIPSRLEKRLMRIFLNRTLIEDPYIFEKALRNRRASKALNSEAYYQAMNHVDSSDLADPPPTLTEIKGLVEHLELNRLFSLSVESSLWEADKALSYKKNDYLRLFNRPMTGNGVKPLFHFLGISGQDRSAEGARTKKILWLADEAGEVMVDCAIIRYLIKLGHKIIIAFKEGPLFTKVDFYDAKEDEFLRAELENVLWINEKNLNKNELIKVLRRNNNIIAISDGTRENLNLLLTSTTFARIFKEVDGIISKGNDQWRRLFDTHFQFTQDIFNISEGNQESVLISYKPRHPSVIKYSYEDLEKKAGIIIDQMQTAKNRGMTVIFYSAIIGSIPGKIRMAKKILSVFVENLTKQSAMTFIINPSEHFEPGMDADDLMYMWEIVQKSGLIDIWRFQTYDDIVEAFQIMDKKVPPEWVGKDATFSTGCTKEMRVALKIQQKHPEMQIIGPSKEKFMRRNEYGIGKMYDQRLSEII